MNIQEVQTLLNSAKQIKEFCDNYNGVTEYNEDKPVNEQLSEIVHKFHISNTINNSNLSHNDRYLSKRLDDDGMSPEIDFMCYAKDSKNQQIKLLNLDRYSVNLFWRGFDEYINNNKSDILSYISDYMMKYISKQYIDDLKKERDVIDDIIKLL